MKKLLPGALFLASLCAGCKKESAVVAIPLSINQKLQAHIWKAHRYFNGTDTASENDNVYIKTATWAFEQDSILKWGGWLAVSPGLQKDTLVYIYKLEQNDTRIRSHFQTQVDQTGFEDLWEIVKLTPDTLLVKRLERIFPGDEPFFLEFLPKK
jgi:hypothetical protein